MAQRRAVSVAVLADIHGNLPALSAVLAEADVADAEAVVLLGDIALGPMPAETLAGLGERAVWVHGNCEREMITAFDGRDVPGANGPQAADSAALMGRPHRDMLDGLPLTVTLDVDGLGQTLFCHAAPRRRDAAGRQPAEALGGCVVRARFRHPGRGLRAHLRHRCHHPPRRLPAVNITQASNRSGTEMCCTRRLPRKSVDLG